MKLEDIAIPEGHVIVIVGDRNNWRPFSELDESTSPYNVVSAVVARPEDYRVVPRTFVQEMEAEYARHDAACADMKKRAEAMPQIRVNVTVE